MLVSSSKAIMLFKKSFTLQDCAVAASFVLTAHCGCNPVVRVLNCFSGAGIASNSHLLIAGGIKSAVVVPKIHRRLAPSLQNHRSRVVWKPPCAVTPGLSHRS